MNRTETIKKYSSKGLLREVEELIDLSIDESWEEPYNYETAFEEIEDRIESGDWASRELRKSHCLLVRIKMGDYRPISDADAAEAVKTGLGLKLGADFPKYKGQRYALC